MYDDMIDKQNSKYTKVIRSIGPLGSEGVGLHHFRCGGAPALAGQSDRHSIILNRSSSVAISCSIGQEHLNHTGKAGNVTLIPAGVKWSANAGGALDNIIVSIPESSFAVAAARADRPSMSITPQITGRDGLLLAIVDEMTDGSLHAAGSDDSWYSLSNELLDHLAENYGTKLKSRKRGILTPEEIGRINSFLASRLHRAIAVDELAQVVAQSASHFPRVFRQTVGLSPYQYIVRLRLRRARELMRSGVPLAETAIRSGFVDQSHLSQWVRRSYGTTPAKW